MVGVLSEDNDLRLVERREVERSENVFRCGKAIARRVFVFYEGREFFEIRRLEFRFQSFVPGVVDSYGHGGFGYGLEFGVAGLIRGSVVGTVELVHPQRL